MLLPNYNSTATIRATVPGKAAGERWRARGRRAKGMLLRGVGAARADHAAGYPASSQDLREIPATVGRRARGHRRLRRLGRRPAAAVDPATRRHAAPQASNSTPRGSPGARGHPKLHREPVPAAREHPKLHREPIVTARVHLEPTPRVDLECARAPKTTPRVDPSCARGPKTTPRADPSCARAAKTTPRADPNCARAPRTDPAGRSELCTHTSNRPRESIMERTGHRRPAS